MLKRLVTISEFVKVSSVLTPDKVNLDLDIDNALDNYNSLNDIDKLTIRLQQYLDQAGFQVNSLSNNQIYNIWDKINEVIENGPNNIYSSIDIASFKQDIDTIKYVVIQWVEYFIYTNKVFADATIEAPSNLSFNITGQSNNANVENKRLDLINILNTTFFFNKIYATGSVVDDYANWTDYLDYSDIGLVEGTENYKFTNGYIVRDVPYLGQENKARLDTLEPKVTNIETINKQLQNNITQLQDLTNTHTRQILENTQKIQTNTNYIDGFYKQYTQYTTQNDSNISAMQTKIDSLTTGLEFQGDWNATTTYSKDNTVQHNGTLWVSLVNNNRGIEPTEANSQYWTNLGSAFQSAIDSSVAKLRQELQPQITLNASNLISAQNDIGVIQNDIEDLKNDDKTLNQKITRNSNAITILQADYDIYKASNDSAISTINSNISTINSTLNNTIKIGQTNILGTNTILDFGDSGLNDGHTYIDNYRVISTLINLENTNNGSNNTRIIRNANELGIDFYGDATGSYTINGSGTPSKNTDLTNKLYVDNKVANITIDKSELLQLNLSTTQNVQGPVNFSNATVNNYRVLTTNDNIDVLARNLVTTDTTQSISGAKTFTNDARFLGNVRLGDQAFKTKAYIDYVVSEADDTNIVVNKGYVDNQLSAALGTNIRQIFYSYVDLNIPTKNTWKRFYFRFEADFYSYFTYAGNYEVIISLVGGNDAILYSVVRPDNDDLTEYEGGALFSVWIQCTGTGTKRFKVSVITYDKSRNITINVADSQWGRMVEEIIE